MSWRLATTPADREDVALIPRDWSSGTLADATDLVLLGHGYASEEEALEAGQRWGGVLQTAFAGLHIGVDFGDRAPQGGISDYLKQRALVAGQRLLNDVHGLMAYETQPAPRFIAVSAAGAVQQSEATVVGALARRFHCERRGDQVESAPGQRESGMSSH